MDLSDLIAKTDLLQCQARQRFEHQISQNPDDKQHLHRLADVMRAQGELAQAITTYERLVQLDDNNSVAKQALGVLTGKTFLSSKNSVISVCPFTVSREFLDVAEQKLVWRLVSSQQPVFEESKVYNSDKRSDSRHSSLLYEKSLQSLRPWFLDKVAKYLKTTFAQLGMDSFVPNKKEIQLTRHQDGEFFKIHRDNTTDSSLASRKVTYVYYFHSRPKQFAGGDLLLFDGSEQEDMHTLCYTRLTPQHNSLLLFPSAFYHQVTPVAMSSREFMDGRFTINGWFHHIAE